MYQASLFSVWPPLGKILETLTTISKVEEAGLEYLAHFPVKQLGNPALGLGQR